MRRYKAEAIVLKRVNVGETDRLVTLFTRNHGKLTVIGRGVRKITSRRSPHLEVFNHVVLVLYKGSGLDIITEVQTLNSFKILRQSLPHAGVAFGMIEVVERFCPEGLETEGVFNLLSDSLVRLCQCKLTRQEMLKLQDEFHLQLMRLLGYLSGDQQLKGSQLDQFMEGIIAHRLESRKLFSTK